MATRAQTSALSQAQFCHTTANDVRSAKTFDARHAPVPDATRADLLISTTLLIRDGSITKREFVQYHMSKFSKLNDTLVR